MLTEAQSAHTGAVVFIISPASYRNWSFLYLAASFLPLSGQRLLHQRTRQTRGDGSVELYGGAQITEKKGSVLTVKTYWPLGVGVEIDITETPTTLNWVHSDRLGSPMGISNQLRELKEKLAYDAWGKRRATDGSILTPDNLDGVVDNKGFTGHEMLDPARSSAHEWTCI